jgi:hypothetical protein
MRSLLAVAAREVGERRMLLALALVAAVLPLSYPLLGVHRANWRLLAVGLAICLTLGAALLTGASVIGRDLSERRLGFFFTRPLTSITLWAGKMLAALVLTATTLALSSLPLLWIGLGDLAWERWTNLALGAGALGLVALIGLAHAASVGYRSRSPWFAADLLLAAGAAAWVTHIVRAHLSHLLMPPVRTLLAMAVAALALAGAAQLAIGRTDARRGHAAQALVLWSVLFAGLAFAQAYTHWLVHPRWSDLVSADAVESAPRGDWIAVVGPARRRGAPSQWSFLANVATGRRLSIGSAKHAFTFAAHGRRAAWVSPVEENHDTMTAAVSVLDLDTVDLQPRTRTLPWPINRSIAIALSADGSRLLMLERGAAVVVDLDGTQPPRRTPLPPGWAWSAVFIDSGHVRLFHSNRPFVSVLRLLDLDTSTGSLTEAGHIDTRGHTWVRVSPDGTRLLVLDRPDRQPSLALHAATGAHLATLTAAGAATEIAADFLADGRIVVVQKDPSVRLRLLSSDGAEERAVELADRWSRARLGGEAAAGQYLVGLATVKGTERQTIVVDLASGRVVRREPGLLPAAWIWFFSRDAGALRPAPGSRATWLFRAEGDVLVEVDPGTGERRTILGR